MERIEQISKQRVGRAARSSSVDVFGALAVVVVVLATLVLPVGGPSSGSSAGAAEPELPEVVEGDVVRVYSSDPSGVRVDPWIVWVCEVEPGGSVPERLDIDAADVVAALEAEIAPYFEWLSRGAYLPTYTPGGSIASGTNDPDDAITTCMDDAVASPTSAGFAGAVVILNAPYEDAVGQSGHQACSSPPCTGSTTLPGNQRTIQLGAHDLFTTTTIGTPWLAETAHEFGHTIDWGHAGPDERYRGHEPDETPYVPTAADAPWLDEIDPAALELLDSAIESQGLPSIQADRAALGSASVDCNEVFTKPPTTPGWSLCILLSVLAYGGLYDVMGTTPSPLSPDTERIPQTQVFNRYAAGWLGADEVAVHDGGFAEYRVAPIEVDGTQMLVLPGSDPRRYVTVEARAATPFLPGDENAGVLVHLVDQRPGACGSPICWGDSDWKTTVYDGDPWNRSQLLEPGDRTTVEGTPVEVVAAHADGSFTIRVGEPPAEPLAPATPPLRPAAVATPVGRSPAFTG